MKNLMKNTIIPFLLLTGVFNSCKKEEVPILNTSAITDITEIKAVSGGTITDEGSGPVLERGVCWNTKNNPTIENKKTTNGEGTGYFSSTLSGLKGGKIYYVKAYATNKAGTGYGNEISFQTAPPKINFGDWITYDNVADRDSNIYRTVKIGEQTWMAENLRVLHYQDGSPIQNITSLEAWKSLDVGAYCFADNDTLNKDVYGALYNYYAVVDQRKICPAGWHVPSDAEWTILGNFLGGNSIAGMRMKEVGLAHWASPNSGAANQSGFTALPAGSRCLSINDDFVGKGYWGVWWSSTEQNPINKYAWYRTLSTFNINLESNYFWKFAGYSIRCVMD
jgi:uncharacterized protein (TIGR02145 family)